MQKILISNGNVEAVVLPDYGGMIAELRIFKRNVLRMNYSKLGLANVLAGGIPILFPFASRCKDDEVTFGTTQYPMPMHGFAKDFPFAIKRIWAQGCELELTSSLHTRFYYPFDFSLTITYEIAGNALRTTLTPKNCSREDMPFAMGTHPYFLASDRTRIDFSFDLKEYDSYLGDKPVHGFVNAPIALADKHDTVFWNGSPVCEMTNYADGYGLHISGDKSFQIITLCTSQESAVCIEPWQSRPDAPSRPEECQWLRSGQSHSYNYEILLRTIDQ